MGVHVISLIGMAEDEDAGLNQTIENEDDNVLGLSKSSWKERTKHVLDATMSYNEGVRKFPCDVRSGEGRAYLHA
jgi:hypothetical protein